MIANIFALTAGLAATASAFDCSGPYFSFYNRAGPAMSIQRLDPALFPGQQSPHLHSFDGGNGIARDTTFAGLQSSTCTSARIKPDNSLYWRPTLFWNGNNTGFYRVPEKFLKLYYKFGDGNVRANVTEFPENFQMIAGDPFKRSDGANPAGIKWACLGPNYSRIDATGFPKGFDSCKEGLTSEITFPSCWNGKDVDPKNPSAHMAYPSNSGKGIDACPTGFKTARFPTIFIEFWYDVSAFDGQYKKTDTPWVLANGDPTGYGWHADFRNGWKKGVLAKATAEQGYCNCGCGCGNDQMKKCFGQDQVNDDNDANFKSCAAKAAYPGDDKAVLEKLPGCNPIQAGPQAATAVSGPDCAAAPTGGSGSGSSSAPTPESSAAGSGSSAAPSATAPASSSKAAASSTKKTSTKKSQTTTAAAVNKADDNVIYETKVIYATVTASPKHKRHGHVHKQ
ncbi:hypothetical protein CC80DRAFT_216657 [Byssothecium circinans]|uniref:DUF1996 domain-containing protein n=1 Tax=Byssothecium circinans TaxID=147558 RepID=A0A6A5TQ58_9PLEO|nr:hypothetical protein CC80DRAFT_216657 [Byssothecium circinans]